QLPGTDPHFASDNVSGAHPEIMDAIITANNDAPPYGGDAITDSFYELVDVLFGSGAYGFPAFNGAGASMVALQVVSHPHSSVLCTDTAPTYHSESSAPEQARISFKPHPHRNR